MADEVIWDKPCPVPEDLIKYVDDNVLVMMRHGTSIKGITPHGASYWTRTAKIETQQKDGSERLFFLKVSDADHARDMMYGEYVNMHMIYEAVPDFVPKPIAWGSYSSNHDTFFFLCNFHHMAENELPIPSSLVAKFAELHRKGISPNGKYGFPVPTCQTQRPQPVDWEVSWEKFFTTSMKWVMDIEDESQGLDDEVTKLKQTILNKVIPRLLRPRETGGNEIQPCLLHTDVWDGNCAVDAENGKPLIFDACGLFGHREYELAPWRPSRHRLGNGAYIKAYKEMCGASEPAEDFEDRVLLYCIRFNMLSSLSYPGNLRFRNEVLPQMRTLVAKFSEGYKGSESMKGEDVQFGRGCKRRCRDGGYPWLKRRRDDEDRVVSCKKRVKHV